jgi:hypothetical protein
MVTDKKDHSNYQLRLRFEIKTRNFAPSHDLVRLEDVADILMALENRNVSLAPEWYQLKYNVDFPAWADADYYAPYKQDVSLTGDGLAISSESDPNIPAIAHAIQAVMAHNSAAGHVFFQWVYIPSRPEMDSYGGGAVFITAQGYSIHTTLDWIGEKCSTSKARQRKNKGVTMAIHSYVALVTSEEGETALQEAIKGIENNVLEDVQYLLTSPNRYTACDGDTLRIWGPVKWYGEFEGVQFIKKFVRDNDDGAYLLQITPGDFGCHEETFGSYTENTFQICTDTSFFYYENGKPKTTALIEYDNQ